MVLYHHFFPQKLFEDFERLRQNVDGLFEYSPSIRGSEHRTFPPLNIGTTTESVEIYAFVPGIDPANIDLSLDKTILVLSGKREVTKPPENNHTHIHERFSGEFRRVISLPDDIDPENIKADYRHGVLHIRINRRAAIQPRRIEVKSSVS